MNIPSFTYLLTLSPPPFLSPVHPTPPPRPSLSHRIVNLSSGLGRVTYVSKERQKEILSPDLTEEKLSAIMEQFVQ